MAGSLKIRLRLAAGCTLGLSVLLVALLLPVLGSAAPPSAREYQVMAAMLYHLVNFVTWPEDRRAPGPIVIGVIGDDPFGPTLDQTLEGKIAGGRSFEVRRIRSLREIGRCDTLFVSQSESDRWPEILEATKRGGVLTVSDAPGFAESGGMIAFERDSRKIQIEINLGAAESARLQISSKLLKLARVI